MALTITRGTADEVAGVVSGSTIAGTSVTSFSPAAGDRVRVQVACLNATDHLGDTFTCVDSHGNSYGTPVYNGDPGDGDGGCYLFVWDHVYATAPGATTLTVTKTNSNAQMDFLILPTRYAGAAADQSGAAKNKFSEAGTPTTTYEIALTPTKLGSDVLVLAAPNHNGGATGPVTAIAGTTTLVDWDDATVGSRGTFGRSTSLTTALTSTTYGWTSANPSPNGYGVMAIEMLPDVAPVGSFIVTDQKTFSWTPAAVGETLLLVAISTVTGSPVTAVSATGATVTQHPSGNHTIDSNEFSAWMLTATTAGSAKTVTMTSGAAAGNLRCAAHAFSGDVFSWDTAVATMDASVTGATTAWPTITPSVTPAVAFGLDFNSGTASPTTGSSSGWNFGTDAHGNGTSFKTGVTGADHPVWTDNDARSVLLVAVHGPAGTSRTASASLTVTPSFTAAAVRTHPRSASLTVTPSFSAAGAKGAPTHTASASLTVTPAFSAAARPARNRSASLTVTPLFTASPHAAHVASASLTVTPAFSAAGAAARFRSASLVISPVLTASASANREAEPGYPGGPLGAKVELNLGGTWTDITLQALPDGFQYGSIKSGQAAGAQQPSPAAMAGTWDNPAGDLSPRNTASPYYPNLKQNTPARVSVNSTFGTRLRLEANSSDRASVNDTAALHVTANLEVRIECRLSDWQGCVLAARYDNTLPSWYLLLNSDGTLTFSWFDSGGTQHTGTTSAPLPYTSGTFAVAVRLNTSALSLGIYASGGIDGTFALLGSGFSYASGAASVRAGNAPLAVGWSSSGLAPQLLGEVTQFRMYNGIGGTKVADAQFASVAPGATSWTDSTGLAWQLAGGAEITARDYRLNGELSSIVPQAQPNGSDSGRVAATLSGRLRRLQQGSQPALESPMRRAILAQSGSLLPVVYWTLEDGIFATNAFGPSLGNTLIAFGGTPQPASDTSFEASAPLPLLNTAVLNAVVPSYSGATAWTVRFLLKIGSTLPPAGQFQTVCQVNVASPATVRTVQVNVDSGGLLQLLGKNSSGTTVFDSAWVSGYDEQNPKWMSVEALPVAGGKVQYNLISLAPGAGTGAQLGAPPQVTESLGNVTGLVFNTGANLLSDSVIGHITVQKAWGGMGTLGQPLNAWRGELAAARFARVCAENGIACRILGSPSATAALGPQPRGSLWTVLKDTVWSDQGILCEPHWAVNGLCFRTRASMTGQSAAVTLSFAAANLLGNLLAADDDQGLLNDITASLTDGTQYRVVLDDGSSRSVSEPPVGAGRYTGQPPQSFNLADATQLASLAAFYLTQTSVDEAKYRQIIADFGVPGAPVADMARTRPGDLIVITDVPAVYQSADIRQLWTGVTEAFGPGRRLTWDCVPASPWD